MRSWHSPQVEAEVPDLPGVLRKEAFRILAPRRAQRITEQARLLEQRERELKAAQREARKAKKEAKEVRIRLAKAEAQAQIRV